MDQSLTPAQARLVKMTFLEKLPVTLVGIPVGISHRASLTGKALERGRDLAASAKPIMIRQSAALIEAEHIFGEERCNGFIEACEAKAIEAEQQVALIRAAREARV